MKSAKKMVVIFQDKILDLKMVHTLCGIITDVTDTSLTVFRRNGKFMIIVKETLLEIKELNDNGF